MGKNQEDARESLITAVDKFDIQKEKMAINPKNLQDYGSVIKSINTVGRLLVMVSLDNSIFLTRGNAWRKGFSEGTTNGFAESRRFFNNAKKNDLQQKQVINDFSKMIKEGKDELKDARKLEDQDCASTIKTIAFYVGQLTFLTSVWDFFVKGKKKSG